MGRAVKRIKVKVNGYTVISSALDAAIESAMNKCDKYNPEPLTDPQRDALRTHVGNYFWLALDEAGVELK